MIFCACVLDGLKITIRKQTIETGRINAYPKPLEDLESSLHPRLKEDFKFDLLLM